MRRLIAVLALLCALGSGASARAEGGDDGGAPVTFSHILPQHPFNPGDDSRIPGPDPQIYRDVIARSVGLDMALTTSIRSGDKIEITFSDGARQTFVVTITDGALSVSKVEGTYRGSPAERQFLQASCGGGAAMGYASGSPGGGVPVFRATYECDGDACSLVSAVVIGWLGGGFPDYANQSSEDPVACVSSYVG